MKKSAIFIGVAIFVVLLDQYLSKGLHELLFLHDKLRHFLGQIFSGGTLGTFLLTFFALVLIPFFTALIPAGVYWFTKKQTYSHFFFVLWITFIVLATALTLKNGIIN